jgi:hypothetical protein
MPHSAFSSCFLLVFLGIWSLGTLTFDALIGWMVWHQARTAEFAETEGVITRSKLKSQRGSKRGVSYSLDVEYVYTIDGQTYTGTRYMYGEVSTNTRLWHDVQRELKVNKPVRVYYDPADPAEAVLRPGLSGMHLFMAWFLTPFNIIMLGGWVYLLRGRRTRFDPNDHRHVETTLTGAAVRLPGLGRLKAFNGTLLVITFIGIFVIAIGYGFNPPAHIMKWAFVGAFTLAGLAAITFGKPSRVEIDDIAQVLRLPGREAIAFADVRQVAVEERRSAGPKGHPIVEYPCLLRLTDADAAPVEVAAYPDQADADALAAWLRQRLGQSQ